MARLLAVLEPTAPQPNWPEMDGGGACTGVCVPAEHRCASGTSVETCDATGTWQRSGIPYSGEGRVAIRYYVTEAGHESVNSDYIGIDRLVGAVATPSYTVGGWVGGLNGSVVLWLNGSEQLTVAANGSFRFPRRLDGGTPYSVRVYAQPAGQLCTVASAAGTIGTANVDDIQVACSSR